MLMRSPARVITAAIAVSLPAHLLLFLSSGAAAAALLIYAGIALPAVWSDKPARRKAAAAVLRQILNPRTGTHRQEMPAWTPDAENAQPSSPPSSAATGQPGTACTGSAA